MLKREEYNDLNSNLNMADKDEPIFILRAQDRLAPELIRSWASRASIHGCSSEKVQEARDLAAKMQEWGKAHGSKFPD